MSASLSGCLCLSGQVSKSQLLLKFQLFLITLAFPAQQILFLFVQTSILSSAFSTYHPHQYHHHDLHHTTTITTTSISTSAKSKNTFQPALILTCTALHSNVTLLWFWPDTETKWEVWLLRTWFGIALVNNLVSLTWLLWALKSFRRFTLHYSTSCPKCLLKSSWRPCKQRHAFIRRFFTSLT